MKGEDIGVLAATVGSASDFQKLDSFMFKMRRKYLGEENARDRSSELKGKQLMANNPEKWAEGDERFKQFHSFLQSSQVDVQPSDGHRLYRLTRLQHEEGEKFTVRKK